MAKPKPITIKHEELGQAQAAAYEAHVIEAFGKIAEILRPLAPVQQKRVIRAVAVLCGLDGVW